MKLLFKEDDEGVAGGQQDWYPFEHTSEDAPPPVPTEQSIIMCTMLSSGAIMVCPGVHE